MDILHTLKCTMKEKASHANEDVAKEGYGVDPIMAVFQAVSNASEAKTQE